MRHGGRKEVKLGHNEVMKERTRREEMVDHETAPPAGGGDQPELWKNV